MTASFAQIPKSKMAEYKQQGWSRDFEIGGARYKVGQILGGPDCMFCPIFPKYWGGPGPPRPCYDSSPVLVAK